MWDAVDMGALTGESPTQRQATLRTQKASEERITQRSLPTAASKNYSVSGIWEKAAPLTETQQQAIEVLSSALSHRPLPPHLSGAQPTTPTTASAKAFLSSTPQDTGAISPRGRTESVERSFEGTSFEDVVLQNSSEFYKWLSVLEAARASETEEKFRRHATILDGHLASCNDLLKTIDEVLALFDALKEGQRGVSDRTAALHSTCERLVNEKEALVVAADALRSKLSYFDELERINAQFHAASVNAGDENANSNKEMLDALTALDQSLAFLSGHPHYADAATYMTKFKQLQGKALATIKGKVNQVLRSISKTLQSTIAVPSVLLSSSSLSQAGNDNLAALAADDGAEVTLSYVKYRAASEPVLKPLLHGIESRAEISPEYSKLLTDCQLLFCETRLSLMRVPVSNHLKLLTGKQLPTLLRSGGAFLLHIAQLESQLFEHLFPISAAAMSSTTTSSTTTTTTATSSLVQQTPLAPLINPLCSLLYDAMRPALGSLRDVDVLCELAFVLRSEVLLHSTTPDDASLSKRDGAISLLEPVLGKVLVDIQERLLYRAQMYIRDSVAKFNPTPADLDYPNILEQGKGLHGTNGEIKEEKEEEEQEEYTGWYPPVQRSLVLLSKLYRNVPQKSFNSVAHEAVAAAAAAVQDASRTVTKTSGPLHGQLFTIRQLLILREQIAPFEADFAVVERGLDFSHVKDYLKRTFTGQLPLFSFSSNNTVLQLVTQGGPRSAEQTHLDAKKDLDRKLKATCEALIMAITKMTVDPALTFLTKVTAVQVSLSGDGTERKPLRDQAFAAPDRVLEVAHAVNTALSESLPQAASALKAYLPVGETRAALFKPIKANITEAYSQLRQLLETEYTPEECATADLPTSQQLEDMLTALS